jgi:hypothetical protein
MFRIPKVKMGIRRKLKVEKMEIVYRKIFSSKGISMCQYLIIVEFKAKSVVIKPFRDSNMLELMLYKNLFI